MNTKIFLRTVQTVCITVIFFSLYGVVCTAGVYRPAINSKYFLIIICIMSMAILIAENKLTFLKSNKSRNFSMLNIIAFVMIFFAILIGLVPRLINH